MDDTQLQTAVDNKEKGLKWMDPNRELNGHFTADVPGTNQNFKGRGNMRLLYKWDLKTKEIILVGLVDNHNANNKENVKKWTYIEENLNVNDFLKTTNDKGVEYGVRKIRGDNTSFGKSNG